MSKFKVLLLYPNLMLVSTLPNNIALLSACLKEHDIEVKLFDSTLYRTARKSNDEMRVERMQVRNFDLKKQGIELKDTDVYGDFVQMINSFAPDLVGVSVLDDTVEMGLKLVKEAGCRKKGIPTILGGVHVYFNASELIKDPAVDILCIGEGEITLIEVCNALKNLTGLNDVPNLMFKQAGKIITTALSAPCDIDALPFEDFSLFEEQRFYRPMQGKVVKTLPINFDRGCPFHCTFCNAPSIAKMYKQSFNKPYFRRKSIDKIYRELKYQTSKYNLEFLYFNSESFLSMPLDDLRQFAEMYSEFNIPFWCQARVETVTEEKIEVLKSMNCNRLSVGLEHGNEKFRRQVLKKSFSNQDVLRAFSIFKKYGIRVSVNNMIGFPDEARDLIFDTIELNRQIEADSVNGFVFQPYIGTYLHALCVQKGYLSKEHIDPEKRTPIGESVLKMPTISREEINGLLRTFVLYVKMPKSFYPSIKQAESPTEEGDKVLAELRDIFFEKYF